MKTITVCKASPTVRDTPVESICLEVSGDIEAKTRTLPSIKEIEHAFMGEADMVMQAINALPQGTRHRLLIMMLKEHQNLFLG